MQTEREKGRKEQYLIKEKKKRNLESRVAAKIGQCCNQKKRNRIVAQSGKGKCVEMQKRGSTFVTIRAEGQTDNSRINYGKTSGHRCRK